MGEKASSALHIKVRGYGQLRQYLPGGREDAEVTVPRGSRLEDLIASLGMAVRDVWLIGLNGQVVEPGAKLQDGDEVEFFLPIGGGSEDKIIIAGMEFWGYGGVSEEERALPQRYLADFELFFDLHRAGHSDDLADTVDYHRVYEVVREVGEKGEFQLLEGMAEAMAHALLQQFPVERVHIRLKKMAPPIPGPLDYVAVEIERSRGQRK